MTNAIPPNWIKSKLRFHPCLPEVDTRNTWVTGITLNKFKLRSNALSGSVTAYGRIYKDGTAIGTERSNSRLISDDFVEYSEDLTISSAGYVQLYVKNSNTVGLATQTKDFTVSCGFLTFPCVETQANHPFE